MYITQYIGMRMRHIISHQKIIDNDQNVCLLLKGKEKKMRHVILV
jgi:hypothetical protein